MATRPKDYYDILGVPEDVSPDDLKKVYRRLAKQNHPDANPDDPDAAERFKEISQAYRVLSDEEQRRKYDQMRRYGGLGGFGARPGGAAAGAGGGRGRGFRFEDLGGLGDIFGSFFDLGGRGRRERGQPSQGRDVEYRVEIPLRVAARGGKVRVTVPLSEECAACDGSGAAPGATLETCQECGGRGTVSFGQGSFSVQRPCPACMGRGEIPTEPCPVCGGRGEVRTHRKISVNVPAGVDDGSRLRLSGQGERGPGGGPSGDVIIRFRVKPDSFFERDGLDLECEVPINLAQATLGSRVRVRTVDRKKVVLKIPPGTQSGTAFRIRGQGVWKGGRKGDQLVRVKVTVPEKLTEEGREALERLAEAEDLRH